MYSGTSPVFVTSATTASRWLPCRRHEVAELVGSGGLDDGHLERPHLDLRPGHERVDLRLHLVPRPERGDADERGDHAGARRAAPSTCRRRRRRSRVGRAGTPYRGRHCEHASWRTIVAVHCGPTGRKSTAVAGLLNRRLQSLSPRDRCLQNWSRIRGRHPQQGLQSPITGATKTALGGGPGYSCTCSIPIGRLHRQRAAWAWGCQVAANVVLVTDASGLIDPSLFPTQSNALGLEWAEEQARFSCPRTTRPLRQVTCTG